MAKASAILSHLVRPLEQALAHHQQPGALRR